MSKPVLLNISYHTCPLCDGTTPHVGGPCISSASTVWVEDVLVCRVGDQLQCNSPSIDVISSGSSTLFIEEMGAALEGISMTAHGGIVNVGGSSTVFFE